MIKFIHTADTHIMDSQYGKKFRGEDFKKAALQVIDIAIERGVDFILHSGDLLDKNRPSEKMLAHMFLMHAKLKAAGIPMYTITGNHDASDPSFIRLPRLNDEEEGKELVNAGIICIDSQTIVHKGLRISGFNACPWELVVRDVAAMADKPDIILWHGAVKEWMPFGVDLSIEDLWPVPFRLAALLGDLHIHKQVRDDAGRIITYPGSTELTKRDHDRDKFVDYYEIEDAKVAKLPDPTPILLATRKVLFLRASSEDQIADCVTQVKDCMSADRPPVIMLTYNHAFRDVVPRIMAVIDPTKVVFRHRVLNPAGRATYQKADGETQIVIGRPSLLSIVDKEVHPTDNLNRIARLLVDPAAETRPLITDFIGERLKALSVSLPSHSTQ